MEFFIDQEQLNQQLSSVGSVVPARPNHPILGTILFEVEDKIKLTGFDLSTAIVSQFDAEVKSQGSIALLPADIRPLINKLSGRIHFKLNPDNNQITIKSRTGKYKISGQDAANYVALPTVDSKIEFELESGDFNLALSAVIYAASTEGTKQILTGVCITKKGSTLEFAATDSHRLTVSQIQVDSNIEDFVMLVPSSGLREILKLTKKSKILKFKIAQNNLQVDGEDVMVIARLLEGVYPNYRQLIPIEFKFAAQFNREEFINKIDVVHTLADPKSMLHLFFKENKVQISTSGEGKEALEEMPVDMRYNNEIEVGFNAKYLLDGIRQLPSNVISIELNADNKPVIFRPTTIDKVDITYLVMPVQVIK